MGTQPRSRPIHLASKLLAIRQTLGASQSEKGRLLGYNTSFNRRISEYEADAREPDLLVLLRYAKVAGISTDDLIDDEVTLTWLAP